MEQPDTSRIDTQVIRLAARGNGDAFNLIFEKYYQRVYNFALWLCNDAEFAEDVSQETFIRAHRNLSKLSPPFNLRAWLLRIARNIYIDSYRRRSRFVAINSEIPDPDKTPEDTLLISELSQPVRTALQGLKEDQREILILREIEGYSYNDIGEALGISLDNVRVLLHRARNAFKDIYELRLLSEEPLPACDVLRDLLDGYVDRELPAAKKAEVKAHIKDCARCQQRRRELAYLALLLKARPILPLPKHFKTRIEKKIKPASYKNLVALAAAILILAMVAGFALQNNSDQTTNNVAPKSLTATATTEQLSSTLPAQSPPLPSPTLDCVCGDSICNPACENTDLCPADCTACNGDNICDPGEGCNCTMACPGCFYPPSNSEPSNSDPAVCSCTCRRLNQDGSCARALDCHGNVCTP